MNGKDIWKKAERWRIAAFELCCWRRLMRVPWTAMRANQSILKESVLNIHLKVWCWSWNSKLWPPDVKNWLTGKDPDAGKDWRWEEKGMTEDEMVGWHQQLRGHELSKLRQLVMDGEAWLLPSMGLQRVGHDWETELNRIYLTRDLLILKLILFISYCVTFWFWFFHRYLFYLLNSQFKRKHCPN